MTASNSSLNNAENKEQIHNDSSNTAQNDVPDSVTEVAQQVKRRSSTSAKIFRSTP